PIAGKPYAAALREDRGDFILDRPQSMSWFTVRVPASSANLGPGFDALGLALGVYLTCRFRRSETLVIRAEGRDAPGIPTDSDNLIWQTAVTVARNHGSEMPPIELHIHNEI